jgi:hypothetical protein
MSWQNEDEYAEWFQARAARTAARKAAQEAVFPEPERTTKILTGTFRVVFHGNYVPVDECAQRLDIALDAGLNDRDDLRTWDFKVTGAKELYGDPEGYDR